MKIFDVQADKRYIIIGYGNLKEEEILALNEVGLIIGEEIKKDFLIKCNKNICIFTLENSNFSINKKYMDEIEIEEMKC